MAKSMTAAQKIFVSEYLNDPSNAAAAYRKAYPSSKPENAASGANRLLKDKKIAEAIQEGIDEKIRKTGINQERILNELAAIAFSNAANIIKIIKVPKLDRKGNKVINKDTKEVELETEIKLVPTDELTEDQQKAIAGIKESKFGIEVMMHDKIKALELLGKHLGMFSNKFELDIPKPVIISGEDNLED